MILAEILESIIAHESAVVWVERPDLNYPHVREVVVNSDFRSGPMPFYRGRTAAFAELAPNAPPNSDGRFPRRMWLRCGNGLPEDAVNPASIAPGKPSALLASRVL